MIDNQLLKPDYLFEVSWEVCNKVGGIYTVVSTKALTCEKEFDGRYILIGPEVWKETRENPDFIEDKFLFKGLREKAEEEGLFFRAGNWNIQGSPIVILVDFTTFFSSKDKIFADFWMKYQLDSLTGQWDYIEPAMFGYAAARVIEHFYSYNLSAQDRIVAHFHEWMTGAGILYLKDRVPQVATTFTTHATIMGRSIAGNSMPLYQEMSQYNPDVMSHNLGIRAKYSMEKIAAAQADSFTTVSKLTVEECRYFIGREIDVVTPNGFENSFVPASERFEQARKKARERLRQVAEAVLGYHLPPDTFFVINSGRYEFRNKGIDLFIDSMWKLNNEQGMKRDVVGFITVPAHQTGPRKDVIRHLGKPAPGRQDTGCYLTHDLFDAESDPVLKRIRKTGLTNSQSERVKIIFVPAYLNGSDGVFDMAYYDLLIGFDLSVFPSYYEPWGYTPLESLAFRIPTLTTSLTGFGLWMKSKAGDTGSSLFVVERGENNAVKVVDEMTAIMADFVRKDKVSTEKARQQAGELAQMALWTKLISAYYQAYSIALDKAAERAPLYRDKQVIQYIPPHELSQGLKPSWKKVMIKPSLPQPLSALQVLSHNLWWTWDEEARSMFEAIDPLQWEVSGRNPVALIEMLSFEQIRYLERDHEFIARLDHIYTRFKAYMSHASDKNSGTIAYFSMEYGLDDSIKIYSGGLGILAGDYLKEISDCNANVIGVGLLYRYGYFNQEISVFGDQISQYLPQKFTHLPLHPVRDGSGEWVTISVALPGRNLYAKAWRIDVGRVPLYLLDTDIEENIENDRAVTHQLYGGDWDNRFKQELLLGVGGIRLLDAIGEKPLLFHCNEGHAAFTGLERLRKLIQDEKMNFQQALEVVRASMLFTTHTPVPAGHDAFSEDVLRTYIPHYADRLGISWEAFMDLGRITPGKADEKFSMSVLAAKLSQETNGVSRIHGKVSQALFRELYPGYFTEEIPIGYVTNGVHLPTWANKQWQDLYRETFGEGYLNDQANPGHWKKIHDVADERIWGIRNKLRKELVDYIRQRVTEDLTRRQENPRLMLEAVDIIDENILTIGFARRFATYKRAHLLFLNPDRLNAILNHPTRPVQLIYAGKAHPYDKAGQDLIKKIVEYSHRKEFLGKIIFVENYEMNLAKKMVQGVDIWLNTPTRPMEASGTSGEKAVMNGVLNLSVLDGWWAEGYKPGAGWALKEARTYAHQPFQDELDADTIYNLLEEEIVPMFYERDELGVPRRWISHIRNNISEIAPHFTMKRMLDDYFGKYYNSMRERASMVNAANYEKAREIANWKRKVINGFQSLEVKSVRVPDSTVRPLCLGGTFYAEVEIDLNELSKDDIGVEIVFGQKENDEVKKIYSRAELTLKSLEGQISTWMCEIPANKSGVFDYAFRIFPKHPLLPHRQDMPLVLWI